jgi:protease IV
MKNKACCWILIALGAGTLLMGISAAILFSTLARHGGSTAAFKSDSYLVLSLDGPIVEYRSSAGFEIWRNRRSTLTEMLKALQRAARDPKIKGVVLKPVGCTGFAEIRELREALLEFKKLGKPIYAHLDVATDRDYYLASTADTIVISPAMSGGLSMMGLGISSTYLARTFDKLGLKFHVLHVGEYKGAYENFAQDSMSTPLRESLQTLLDDLFATYTGEIAATRSRLSAQILQDELLHGKKLLITGENAVAEGFADRAMDWGDFRERLAGGGKFNSVTPQKYLKNKPALTHGEKEIAVLFAGGEISYGQSQDAPWADADGIHSADFIKQLRDLREDKDVAAVVLRVNSPGGSALASELILQEVRRLKAAKPVVVSMGNVAASGGYYISCAANRIFAQPNTVTGSIGVVAMLPTAEGLYRKIGAREEVVTKGKWAQFFRLDKDLNSEQNAVLLDFMNDVYEEFVQRVADGRGLPVEQVKTVAAGRIWTGNQALERKLVDELGGLDQAIEAAKGLAHLKDKSVTVRYYPRDKDFLKFMLQQLTDAKTAWSNIGMLSTDERQVQAAIAYLNQFVRQRDFVQTILPMTLP